MIFIKNTLQFLSGTFISRCSGMVRDIVVAFSFGTHEALAALFIAFRLSHTCRRLFGEGAMQSALIPLFEELRKDSPQRAFFFFRDLTVCLAIFLGSFCFMLGYSSGSPRKQVVIGCLLTKELCPFLLFFHVYFDFLTKLLID